MSDNEFFKFTPQPQSASPEPPQQDYVERPTGTGRARSTPGCSLLNDAIALYVAVSAVLTAVPVALNRTQLWLIWLILTAGITLAYLGLGYWLDRKRRLLSARQPWLFGLALIVPIYALIQTLPFLGGLVEGPPVPDALSPDTISLMPGASQMGALRFTGYILFALLAIEVASRTDRAWRIGWWIFWGVVLHAVWALIALNVLGDIHIWGADKRDYAGSATGTFVNRNSFATFLGMGAMLGIALLYEKLDKPVARKARSRSSLTPERLDAVLVVVGLGLIGITLMATQSRMGVFASGLGAALCYLLMRIKGRKSVLVTVLQVGGVALAGAVLAFLVYGQDLLWRTVFVGQNAETRGAGYELILGLIGERPLLGYGFDAFRPTFELVHIPPMNPDLVWDRAHSTYLAHWSELGLIVGSVPIMIAILAALRLIGTIRRRERDYALGIAGLSALIIGAVHSLVDFSLEMPANVILLLAILGLGLAHRAPPRARTTHKSED